jgi:hypothetical protein
VRYYSITIPGNSSGTVLATSTGTPAWDLVLRQQTDCAATACLSAIDASSTAAETLVITNASASPITRIVSVGSDGAPGTYDLAFTTAPLAYLTTTIPQACVTTGTFTPVARTGTTNDSTTAITALPFSTTFFGDTVTHFSAGTDGFVRLWTSATGTPASDFSNDPIPATATPNAMIAAFWDDLYFGTTPEIRTQTIGTAGSQTFVIEWTGWLVGSSGPATTFQAHILESGVIELHYCVVGTSSAATGSGATIGLENATGTGGVQTSYNTAGAVSSTTGYRYTPNP